MFTLYEIVFSWDKNLTTLVIKCFRSILFYKLFQHNLKAVPNCLPEQRNDVPRAHVRFVCVHVFESWVRICKRGESVGCETCNKGHEKIDPRACRAKKNSRMCICPPVFSYFTQPRGKVYLTNVEEAVG